MANETQIYVGKLGAQTLYKRLKQLIGRITTYKKVPADEHGYPDESNPDSRTIYLVKDESVVGEDKFFEWIWTAPNIWECIGTTSEPCNSWKQWSEENGSSGDGDSVYIGKNNDLGRDESYSLGKDNTVEVTDDTDYTDTDIVEIGTSNTATNAANTYQLGRENSVSGNNLAYKDKYPHSMALNLGRNNAITGEGVNVGKDNVATRFGITLGQKNDASDMGIAIGENLKVKTSGVAIGLGQHHKLTMSSFPSLRVGNNYYPIGEIRPRTTPADFHYYSALAFKDSKVIQVYPINGNCYINTAKKTMYYLPDGVDISTNYLGTGYIDDNGQYVITSTVPPGKDRYDFNILKAYTENGIRHDVNFIYTTTSGYGSWKYTSNSYNYYTTYSYGDTLPLYKSSEVVKDGGYAILGGTKIYRNNESSKYYDLPFIKCDILGYYDNGTFIPWFNNNYDKAVCVWKEFELPDVQGHSYTAAETEALGYTMDDKSVYLAEDGSVAIGDLVCADEGSVAINSGVRALHGLANPVVSSTWVKEYTGNGNSWTERSFEGKTWMYPTYPTNATMRSTILDNVVTGGALGLFTGSDDNPRQASRIAAGSFGVGNNLNVNTKSIAMGENISAARGSFAYGNGSGLTVDYGSIALESTTASQNVSSGSVLIGVSNKGDLNGGDLVVGGYNYVGSSGGVTAIGNNNTVYGGGAHAFGSYATAKYGGMALGFQTVTAESGAIALGFSSATAKYGAMALGFQSVTAEYGGVAIGYSDVTAKNRGFAFGTETCTGDGGFAIGRNGATAKSGGFSLGYDGIKAETGAIAIGYNSASALYGGITIGYNSATSSGGSMALGFDSVTAEYGGFAIGSSSYARNGSFTLGKCKFARDGSIAIGYSRSDIGPLASVQTFLYYKTDYTAYPVNVQLSGISYVKGKLVYDANGNYAPIEYTSGDKHFFKSSVSGKLYERASDIPFTDYVVKVMSIASGSGTVPYEIIPWSYNPLPPTSYSWVEYPWGTSKGKVTAVKRAPYEFGINVAESGGFGLGDMFYASGGSLAIASSQFADSPGTDVPTIKKTVTKQTITCVTDQATAKVDFEHSLYFGDTSATKCGFSGYGAKSTNDSVAIGGGVQANNRSTALGYLAYATGSSIAIGYGPKYVTVDGQVQLSQKTTADSESLAIGDRSSSTSKSIVLGVDSRASSESWTMGHSNIVESISIGIGKNNYASSQSISMGDYNSTNFNAYAIGSRNNVYGWSLALGVKNKTSYVHGAHTAFIGYLNESSSNMETLEWVDSNTNAYSVMPINTNAKYSISQQIYKSSEIQTGGTIYTISFYLNESTGSTRNNISIYLLDTDKAEYSTSYDWVTTTMSPAYSGSVQFVEGWNTIYLTNSYSHDNSKNLSVLVIDNSGDTTSLGIRFKCSADPSGAYTTMYNYNNSSSYSTPTSSTYGSRLAYRPVIKFNFGGTEVCVPDMPALIGNVPTSSIILGALNNSKHYNSILVGVGNQSGVDKNIQYNKVDDDGFVLAIGRENYVGRNYDIAIGYKSVADGGENVAVQHSYASGYRNIAMVDSTLKDCTANIALIESKLTLNNVYESTKNVIHNTLIHSDFTIANGNTSNNFILHTTGGMGTQATGIHSNIIMVGSEYHPLNVSAVAATNNIIYGFRTGYTIARSFTDNSGNVSVASSGKIDRNILLNNAYGNFVSGEHITDNIINASELEITASKEFQDNVMLSSLAYMTYPTTCVKNVILGKSRLDIRADAANVNNNFLMYSFLGDSNNGSAIVTGEYTHNNASNCMAQNFLFGTNAYHVGASVSFANPDRATSPENAYYDSTAHYQNQLTAMLIDCVHVFNFGDNLLKGVDESYVFGAGQNVHSADNVVVYGNRNELSYTSGSIVMGAKNNVLGMRKELPGQVSHNVIIGSENNIKAGYATDCNMIFGNNNTIQGHYTVVQKTTAEVATLPANTPEYFKTSADCLYPDHANDVYIESGNYYYFYSNGSLFDQYGAPTTGSIVNTTTLNLLSNFNSHSLTEGTWYHPTSGSRLNAGQISGSWIYANTVYYHYNSILNRIGASSTGDIGVYNCYNRIFGHANNVYDHVIDYTVIGAANSVSCTDYLDPFDYSISNGFIQGNNNTATNGSNIISMGNGNLSVGHNSVAIGSQLISKQWQTVIGKYNQEVNGPNRVVAPFSPNKTYVVNEFVYYDNNYYRCTVAVTTAGAWTGSTNWTVDYPDQESALFVVGNGYSETDGTDWQDETKIHRSNALEVYADGTVWARKFVSDEPTLSLSSGTGIDISETSTNVVISLDADTANIVSVIKSRPQTGRYVLESNDGVLSWVNVGIV